MADNSKSKTQGGFRFKAPKFRLPKFSLRIPAHVIREAEARSNAIAAAEQSKANGER